MSKVGQMLRFAHARDAALLLAAGFALIGAPQEAFAQATPAKARGASSALGGLGGDSKEPIKIDADKLDVLGAIGVARTIAYAVQAGQPTYAAPSQRFLESGEKEPGEPHSAYHEYLFKLRRVRDRLNTPAALALAETRHADLVRFFEALADENELRDWPDGRGA